MTSASTGDDAAEWLETGEYVVYVDERPDPSGMHAGLLSMDRRLHAADTAADVWERHPSCAGVGRLNAGKRTMLVRRFDIRKLKALTVDDVLFRELAASGMRPAVHTELFALAEAFPPPRRECLIAPGSYKRRRHGRLVACYARRGEGWSLTSLYSPGGWGIQNLFLFVRTT